MSKIWKKEYELNIDRIDEQHRNFFKMLESTDELIEKKEFSAAEVMGVLRFLLDFRSYGMGHFSTEEKLMAEMGYSEIFDHIEMHDKYIEQMSKYMKEFLILFKGYQNGNEGEERIREFFDVFVQYATKWYQEHISNVDSKYAYYLKKKA